MVALIIWILRQYVVHHTKLMKGNDGISYLTATNFDSDNALHFEIKKPMTLIKIQNLINKEYNLADTLYAAKVIGKFEYINASNQNRVLNQIFLKKWSKHHLHDFTSFDRIMQKSVRIGKNLQESERFYKIL